jgi:chromosome partitioning protein
MERRNEMLLNHLKRHLSKYTSLDPKCISLSTQRLRRFDGVILFFDWGYHIVDGTRPRLAFNEIGGISHPRADFFQLAEYLENHTDIDKLRAQLWLVFAGGTHKKPP